MASEALSRPGVGGGTAKRKERTMDGNFTIGRYGGVEVRLHWSLLAVFALIVWSLADGVFPSQNPGLSDGTYLGIAIVAALLYLASILLHELGHSWVARREGIEVDSITLAARRRGGVQGSVLERRHRVPTGPLRAAHLDRPGRPVRVDRTGGPADRRRRGRGVARLHQPHPGRLQPPSRI